MSKQKVRELGYGEDEDQVEEQFDQADLASLPSFRSRRSDALDICFMAQAPPSSRPTLGRINKF